MYSTLAFFILICLVPSIGFCWDYSCLQKCPSVRAAEIFHSIGSEYFHSQMGAESFSHVFSSFEEEPESWILLRSTILRGVEGLYYTDFKPMNNNGWRCRLRKVGGSRLESSLSGEGQEAGQGLREYWTTEKWSREGSSSYLSHADRKVYTYLGSDRDLTVHDNAFASGNNALRPWLNLPPERSHVDFINYIRGADAFDFDGDRNQGENRPKSCGALSLSRLTAHIYEEGKRVVFWVANDGMVHAIDDETGRELWAFIPPDQLSRLKLLLEENGDVSFMDSSPMIVHLTPKEGNLEQGERVYLIFGEGQGGRSFYALDVTEVNKPRFQWWVSNICQMAGIRPSVCLHDSSRRWTEPSLAMVRPPWVASQAVPSLLFGGDGKLYVIDVETGELLESIRVSGGGAFFQNGLSAPLSVDGDGNGFIDKVYMLESNGRLWRLGKFNEPFPRGDENLTQWKSKLLFSPDPLEQNLKFYNVPTLLLEKQFDLLLFGSGDRENICKRESLNRLYAIRDNHRYASLTEENLRPLGTGCGDDGEGRFQYPNQSELAGWFIRLSFGEKIIEPIGVFAGVVYASAYIPPVESCGGRGRSKLYALHHMTGDGVFGLGWERERGSSRGVTDGVVSAAVLYKGGTDSEVLFFAADGSRVSPIRINGGSVRIRRFFLRWWKEVF